MKLPELTKRAVYLDHAAATPVDSRVLAAMASYFAEMFGNPGGLYSVGRDAANALAAARRRVAAVLQCRVEEIIFTGSGTESDNLALFGIARAYASKGKHIIVSAIEHHAVLVPALHLQKDGFEITVLQVNECGEVSTDELIAAVREDTTLISVMYANNEIGTVEPIAEIGRALRQWKKARGRGPTDAPFFHTDACQAAVSLDMNAQKLGVDLLTLNGSKMYGPKGAGVLFMRRGLKLSPIIFGGGQERGLRSGTENVVAIVGLATALELAQAERATENARLIELREYLRCGLLERIPKIVLNGHPTNRLPNNLNISILDIEGEALLLYADEYGIALSTGSACTSRSLDPSHVILALGKPYEYAHGSIRFTLGHSTSRADIEHVFTVLPPIVELLRSISPINLSLSQKPSDIDRPEAFVMDGAPHWLRNKN